MLTLKLAKIMIIICTHVLLYTRYKSDRNPPNPCCILIHWLTQPDSLLIPPEVNFLMTYSGSKWNDLFLFGYNNMFLKVQQNTFEKNFTSLIILCCGSFISYTLIFDIMNIVSYYLSGGNEEWYRGIFLGLHITFCFYIYVIPMISTCANAINLKLKHYKIMWKSAVSQCLWM